MAYKDVKYNHDARKKVTDGFCAVAKAVKHTLGPGGSLVLMDRSYGAPRLTKDGVSVAKEIELEDKHENLGAKVIKDIANRTVDSSGDGTSTAVILSEEMLKSAIRCVESGGNPSALKKGMEKAREELTKCIRNELRSDISKEGELVDVATVAANGDEEVGKIVATAFSKVGKDGTVAVEEGERPDISEKTVLGMEFEKGYCSSYFATGEQRVVLENCLILLYDKKISSVKNIVHLLQDVAQDGRPLLIIAEDVDGDALATLVINKLRAGLKVCAVKSPGFGSQAKDLLTDIAVLVGLEGFISEEKGDVLEKVKIKDLGQAKKVIVTKDNTTIVDGIGSKESIAARVAEIEVQLDDASSDYERKKLEKRRARLKSGVSVITVGAFSESERSERKDRVEDAIGSTSSAMREGFVPGGGVALLRAGHSVASNKTFMDRLDGDEKTGAQIVLKALSSPIKQIAQNAGYDDWAIMPSKVLENNDKHYGWDAVNKEFCNLVSRGIVDSFGTVIQSLKYAVSGISCIMLSVSATITDAPSKEDKSDAHPSMGGGMGGMDY